MAVINDVAIHIFLKFQRMPKWHPLLNYEQMALFAEAISDLIEPGDGHGPWYMAGEGNAVFWGFVDGTY